MSTDVDALTVTGLHAGYDRYDVLHGVDLRVGRGETVGLLGPNGAGKSTLLRAVTGMMKNSRGSVQISGTEVMGMASHQIGRGYAALAPEGRRLFTEQSVEDNLILGGYNRRGDRTRIARLLDSVYELFPVLHRHRKRQAWQLSGGEQQMVAIGRMMMADADVMLLDEPSLGLAPLAIEAVSEALTKLAELGRSMLIVEQRVDVVMRTSERVYVLVGGHVVAEEQARTLGDTHRDLIMTYLA